MKNTELSFKDQYKLEYNSFLYVLSFGFMVKVIVLYILSFIYEEYVENILKKMEKKHFSKIYKKITKKYKYSLVYKPEEYDQIISEYTFMNQEKVKIHFVINIVNDEYLYDTEIYVNQKINLLYDFIVFCINDEYVFFFKNKNKFSKFKMLYLKG